MNNDKIIELINRLKQITSELESEIKSDPGSFVMSDEHYNDVVWYYRNDNDDDEEGL